MNPHNVTICMHAYILKCHIKQLIVYVHSLYQITIQFFLLNFDGYYINNPPGGSEWIISIGDYVDYSFTALGSSDPREVRLEL